MNPRTILVVDDEPTVRLLCRLALERAGYEVLEAEDGEAAKEVLASAPRVDVLVADVEMPRLTGPALVEEVLPRMPDLKVLYISGHYLDSRTLQRHTLEWGAAFLPKPFTFGALVNSVRTLLVATISAEPRRQRAGGLR